MPTILYLVKKENTTSLQKCYVAILRRYINGECDGLVIGKM